QTFNQPVIIMFAAKFAVDFQSNQFIIKKLNDGSCLRANKVLLQFSAPEGCIRNIIPLFMQNFKKTVIDQVFLANIIGPYVIVFLFAFPVLHYSFFDAVTAANTTRCRPKNPDTAGI